MSTLQEQEKIILVTHKRPDDDSVYASFLLLKALDISQYDVEWVFVPKGEQYQSATTENARIFHVDVGGITDPKNDFFDHHFSSDYYCAAEIVAKYFWKDEFPPEIRTLVDLAIFKDTASEIGGEDNRTRDIRTSVNSNLRKLKPPTNVPLRCIPDRKGPTSLSMVIHNLNDLTYEKIMEVGLLHVQAWFNQQRTEREMKQFMEYFADVETINAAKAMVIQNAPYSAGKLRNYVRRRHYFGDNRLHLLIAEYDKTRDDLEYRFSIMTVHSRSAIKGMDDLHSALCASSKRNASQPFLHKSKAFIHIKAPTNFTLKLIMQHVRQHIRMPWHEKS